MTKYLLLTIALVGVLHSYAQSAGDIAFVGYNADGDKDFSIVVLKDLDGSSSSISIFFTDDEWDGSNLTSGEGTLEWTINTLIEAGTVVSFNSVSVNSSETVSVGSLAEVSGGFSPNAGKEAILAYVGTLGSPSGFLAAITNDDFVASEVDLAGTGLTIGTHAVELDAVDTDADIAEYNGTREGTLSELLSAINDGNNWLAQDGTDVHNDGEDPDVPFSTKAFTVRREVTWDGDASNADWTTDSNWSDDEAPGADDMVTIDDIVAITETETIEIYQLNIDGSGELEISSAAGSGGSLIVSGDLTNNGLITVQSGSTLALKGSYSGTGSTNVKRKISGSGALSFMSSPVSDEAIADISANHVYGYNATTQDYEVPTGNFSAGTGYFIGYKTATPEVSFSGDLNHGEVNVPLTTTEFQAVGNPYAAPISISEFLTENASDNTRIDGTVYLWDDGGSNVGGNRGGDYITVNNLGATVSTNNLDDGVNGNEGETAANTGNIASTQGFFVNSETTSEDLVFSTNMMVTAQGANDDADHYRLINDKSILRLALAGNDLYNELIIGATNNATFGRDYGLDAVKLTGNADISFYSRLGDDLHYAIQGIPYITEEHSISLGYDLSTPGDYQIKVVGLENFDGFELSILDNETGITHVIVKGTEINFNSAKVINSDRFELIMAPTKVLGSSTLSKIIELISFGEGINIGYKHNGTYAVTIHNLEGKLLHEELVEFANGEGQINFHPEKHYIYLLSVATDQLKFIID
ncbi:MAG: hypothetical protein RIC35_09070 [Marinoscillum sp.]